MSLDVPEVQTFDLNLNIQTLNAKTHGESFKSTNRIIDVNT